MDSGKDDFINIRTKLRDKGLLYEDPVFATDSKNLFFSHDVEGLVQWCRPSVSILNDMFVNQYGSI